MGNKKQEETKKSFFQSLKDKAVSIAFESEDESSGDTELRNNSPITTTAPVMNYFIIN